MSCSFPYGQQMPPAPARWGHYIATQPPKVMEWESQCRDRSAGFEKGSTEAIPCKLKKGSRLRRLHLYSREPGLTSTTSLRLGNNLRLLVGAVRLARERRTSCSLTSPYGQNKPVSWNGDAACPPGQARLKKPGGSSPCAEDGLIFP